MQLDSCLFQTYSTNPKADEIGADFLTCFKNWALLTKSPFYEHPHFQLPWYFGVMCFNYSLAGIFMIYIQKPKFMENKACSSRFFPYYTYAYLLVFLQGPLSYLADYQNMDKSSLFHAVDRCLAIPLCTLEFVKITLILRYSKQTKIVLWAYSTAFLTAIFSFILSQVAQTQKNVVGFIFWHCLWHIYPLIAVMIVSIEHMTSRRKIVKTDKKDHNPVLSDLVLKKMSNSRKKKVR